MAWPRRTTSSLGIRPRRHPQRRHQTPRGGSSRCPRRSRTLRFRPPLARAAAEAPATAWGGHSSSHRCRRALRFPPPLLPQRAGGPVAAVSRPSRPPACSRRQHRQRPAAGFWLRRPHARPPGFRPLSWHRQQLWLRRLGAITSQHRRRRCSRLPFEAFVPPAMPLAPLSAAGAAWRPRCPRPPSLRWCTTAVLKWRAAAGSRGPKAPASPVAWRHSRRPGGPEAVGCHSHTCPRGGPALTWQAAAQRPCRAPAALRGPRPSTAHTRPRERRWGRRPPPWLSRRPRPRSSSGSCRRGWLPMATPCRARRSPAWQGAASALWPRHWLPPQAPAPREPVLPHGRLQDPSSLLSLRPRAPSLR
mmetsp:Transcript_79912/g.246504  ORF Transcript_79912/g.246504 Transcript_79912/m.246504 type:complete len:360 (+) Transcript_79912:1043-2122(+)